MIPSYEFVHEKLKELGPALLKPHYKNKWVPENPTYGYCYIVSEAIFHYINENNIEIYCINFGEKYGTHWYCKINGEIVDYTAHQFPFIIDYSKGIRKGFFKGGIKTQKGYISKRGYELAKHLTLVS